MLRYLLVAFASTALWTAQLTPNLSAKAQRIFKAWIKETNPRAKAAEEAALLKLGAQLQAQAQQARGGRYYPEPFQTCTEPKSRVFEISVQMLQGTQVRVTLKNISKEPQLVYKYRSPAEMFSITVLDSTGQRARIREDRQFLYLLPAERAKLPTQTIFGTHLPFPMALKPGEETTWDWDIAEEFVVLLDQGYTVKVVDTNNEEIVCLGL